MTVTLQEQLMGALHRFQRASAGLPSGIDMRMNELFALDQIARMGDGGGGPVFVSDVRCRLVHLSRPAVSQLLGALEKRGYLVREPDRGDRRRVAVRLTDRGSAARDTAWAHMHGRLGRVIDRFGEDNARQLIALLAALSDAADQVRLEYGIAEYEEGPCEKRV
ncbi:MAG: MarR family transcriptional regulator [Clostridiales bacterium]|nr:MarR family transcriptional regulator [Clostridiales bacterium]